MAGHSTIGGSARTHPDPATATSAVSSPAAKTRWRGAGDASRGGMSAHGRLPHELRVPPSPPTQTLLRPPARPSMRTRCRGMEPLHQQRVESLHGRCEKVAESRGRRPNASRRPAVRLIADLLVARTVTVPQAVASSSLEPLTHRYLVDPPTPLTSCGDGPTSRGRGQGAHPVVGESTSPATNICRELNPGGMFPSPAGVVWRSAERASRPPASRSNRVAGRCGRTHGESRRTIRHRGDVDNRTTVAIVEAERGADVAREQ